MNIIGHEIQTQEVIGVGPLCVQVHPDPAMRSLYNSKRYSFDVHCKSRDITICSNYFNPGGNDSANKEERESMKKWKVQYDEAREDITTMLNKRRTKASHG